MSTIDYYQILRNSVLGGLNNQVNVPAAVAGSLATEIYHAKDSAHGIARTIHPNAHKEWSDEDEAQLTIDFAAVKMKFIVGSAKNQIISDIAHKFGRSPGGIIARLIKLGII